MTRDQATQGIAEGLEAIHAAYWAVCDAEGQAIDPAALLAPNGVLDDAFDIALGVEVFAEDKGISWAEARERFCPPRTFFRAVYDAALGHVGPAVRAGEVSHTPPRSARC